MDVADKIKMLQRKYNLNNAQLADKANLSRSTIISILNRKSRPRDDTLTAICSAFGMTTDEFRSEGYIPPELDSNVAHLVECYYRLPEKKQNILITLADELSLGKNEE